MNIFKILMIILISISSFIGSAHTVIDPIKHTQEKTINKRYTVGSKTSLTISNYYGNVDISVWEKNIIEVEVHILVSDVSKEAVEHRINNIDITMFQKEELVGLYTLANILKAKEHIEINFKIRVPENCHIDAAVTYGDFLIGDTNADVDAYVAYGSMRTGKLMGEKSTLRFSYAKKSQIAFVNTAMINSHYSDFNIQEANSLFITEMKSSNGEIEKVKNIEFTGKYGSLDIGLINGVLVANTEYLTLNVNKCEAKKLTVKSRYGTIAIKKWNNQTSDFDLNGTTLNLGYLQNIPFKYEFGLKAMPTKPLVTFLENEFTVRLNKTTNNSGRVWGHHVSCNTPNRLHVMIRKGVINLNAIQN